MTWTCPLPGERVLNLTCGTGLVSFLAKRGVVASGLVTGVDLGDEMMPGKQKADSEGLGVRFIHHDITDLEALRRVIYGLTTCATAFVLFGRSSEDNTQCA